jgi:hypothetical protein
VSLDLDTVPREVAESARALKIEDDWKPPTPLRVWFSKRMNAYRWGRGPGRW